MVDKSLDLHIYRHLGNHPSFKNDLLRRRRVLQTRILKLSPEDFDSYERMGKLLFDAGKLKPCTSQLKRAIIIYPKRDPKIHIILANAFRRLKKENECLCAMKKALCFSPADDVLLKFSIKTLEVLRKFKDIDSFYQDIVNMMKNPNNVPILYFESAEILVSSNKYPEALRNYQRAIETITQQSSDYYCSERFRSQYGVALIHEGLFEEALDQFEQILKKDPKHRFSLSKKAFCYYLLEKVQKAFDEFEHIVNRKLHVKCDGGVTTFLPFLLVLYHLVKEEEIKKYQAYICLRWRNIEKQINELRECFFREEARSLSELQRDDIDEKTREFHVKKIQACQKVRDFMK